MPVSAIELKIPAPKGRPRSSDEGSTSAPAPGEGWTRLCRFALRIDARAAARLWAALPQTMVLVTPGEVERERILRILAQEGVPAAFAPEPLRYDACARHARLIASEVCPRCSERRACALCLHAEAEALCPACRGRARFFTRFRNVRIAVLLTILASIVAYQQLTKRRIASLRRALTVNIYPIDVDPAAHRYSSSLGEADFAPVARFFQREAGQYGLTTAPLVELRIAAPITEQPPPAPDPGASMLTIARWSFAFRLWSFRVKRGDSMPSSDVDIFVLYHASAEDKSLDRSTGVEKLRVGIVNATASKDEIGWTQIVIAHELLHTVGATDRYEATGMPSFPEGYAAPALSPRYPQARCEIMAGQIPITEHEFREPTSLDECMVGPATAAEIGWGKAR